MQSKASSPEEYINELPEDRKHIVIAIRNIVLENLPEGFEEEMSDGMLSYVVPHSVYPQGYHCNPSKALPFLSIASQKNFVAVYHMGIYAHHDLLNWFREEYSKLCSTKLDMGKSCIRFKKMEQIPLKLIGELASKMTAREWIGLYEEQVKRK